MKSDVKYNPTTTLRGGGSTKEMTGTNNDTINIYAIDAKINVRESKMMLMNIH